MAEPSPPEWAIDRVERAALVPGNLVHTMAAALADVRSETVEECAQIIERDSQGPKRPATYGQLKTAIRALADKAPS